MEPTVSAGAKASRNGTTGNRSEFQNTPRTWNEDWLYDTAKAVAPNDTGLQIHYVTGWPVSTCYSYLAKDKEKRSVPRADFLQQLFHSDHGQPFLLALMEGCKARWWIEYEHAHRVGQQVLEITKRG